VQPRIWKASTHSAKAEAAAKHELKFPHQSDRLGLGHKRFNNDPNPKEWRKLVLGQHKLFNQEDYLAHSHQLPRQGVWTTWKDSTETVDLSWNNLLYKMSPRLVKFMANSMINMVLTPDLMQLYQWSTHATCVLCKHPQCTLHHILVNCKHSLHGGRYNWRHDSVLRGFDLALSAHIQKWNAAKPRSKRLPTLAVSFAKTATAGSRLPKACLLDGARDWEICVDYDRAMSPFPADICITSQRPDIVIMSRSLKKVIPIELTCPAEEGIVEAKIRKEAKYNKELVPLIKKNGWSPTLMTVEVGARGCPGRSVRSCLRKIGLSNTMAGTVVKAVSLTSARCSLVVYQFREIPEWNRKRDLFTGAYGKLRPTPVVQLAESKNTKQKQKQKTKTPSPSSSPSPSPSTVPSVPSCPSTPAVTLLSTKQKPSTDMSPSMPLSLLTNDQYRSHKSLLMQSRPHYSPSPVASPTSTPSRLSRLNPCNEPTRNNIPRHNNRRRSGNPSSNRRFSLNFPPLPSAVSPPSTPAPPSPPTTPPSPLTPSVPHSFLRERKTLP
jgi:hypothetical protein